MYQTTVGVDGMMCGMCESHVNDAIRANFNVKKVSSSHSKNRCEIVSENGINAKKAAEVLGALGYKMTGASEEEYKKKGFLFFK